MGKKDGVKKSKNLELLYMARQDVSIKDLEKPLLDKLEEIHVWPEIGIMELNMPSGIITDVETMTEFMEEEEDIKFMEERQIQSVYALTVAEEGLSELMDYVKIWIREYGGLLCSDSDDFTPIYIQ